MVINGGATSSGEQDNEDTELMAIYTTENGIAEKVSTYVTPPSPPPPLSQVPCRSCVLHLGLRVYPPEWVWVCVGLYVGVLFIMEIEGVMKNRSY